MAWSLFTKKSVKKGAKIQETSGYPKGFIPYTSLNTSIQPISFDVLTTLYNTVPEINAIVTYIAQVASGVKIKHVKINNSEKEKEVKFSPVINLLNNPNQIDKGYSLKMNAYTTYFVTGNVVYNKITPLGFDYSTKLYLLPTSKVFPIIRGAVDNYGNVPYDFDYRTTELISYNYLLDSNFVKIEAKDIIHIKDSSINYTGNSFLFGASRIGSAVKTIQSLSNLAETINNVLGQGGALGFVKRNIRAGETLQLMDPESKKEAENNFYNYGLSKGRGVFFTPNDLSYVKIFDGLSQFMPVELKDSEFDTLCKVIGGFPKVLLQSSDTTFTNLTTAQRLLYENIVIPLVNSFCEAFTKGFNLPENEKIIACWDEVEALKEDEKLEYETKKIEDDLWLNRYNNNLCTLNEMLEAIDLKAQTDGNKFKKEIEPTAIEQPKSEQNQAITG